jgi:hypothetical protein
MADIYLDPAAIDYLLNDPAGPVGMLIEELSVRATAIARVNAPIITRPHYSHWGRQFDPRYQYGDRPGATRASVHPSGFRFNALGQLYSGVNAAFGSTLFLQSGGGRYGHAKLHPFMTTALMTVTL